MSSLYARYIKERENMDIIEDEYGFCTYKFISDDTCYIVDCYVTPEKRKNGKAREYDKKIQEIAKEKGCKQLLGSVDLRANGCEDSMKMMNNLNYKIKKLDNFMIYYTKEL